MKKNVSNATDENIEKTLLTRIAAAFTHTAIFAILWQFWDQFATDLAAVHHFLKVFAACAVLASILLSLDALWRRSWLSWTPF